MNPISNEAPPTESAVSSPPSSERNPPKLNTKQDAISSPVRRRGYSAKEDKNNTNKRIYQGVRVRIAPSPTGTLHIGTARTALFNFLFARHNKGKFYLRIEDTDTERSRPEFEKDIIENLRWLGLKWDGRILKQSRRRKIYAKYIKKLLDSRRAFWCYHTKEELENEKRGQASRGEAQVHFCEHKNEAPPTGVDDIFPSFSGAKSSEAEYEEGAISSPVRGQGYSAKEDKPKFKMEQVRCKQQQNGTSSLQATAKFKIPGVIRLVCKKEKIIFNDLIRGKIEFDPSQIGDIVIAKDAQNPLYNLAVVIDDYETKITHIIRGEDHISNTPKQIIILEALGLFQPRYAHIPLTLAPDKTKLSKRHGATSIQEYREIGYLPEALINFMAFSGWNPGTEKEIFSLKELVREFTLERMQKSAAVFNIEKLDWFNGYYIRQMPLKELTKKCIPHLEKAKLIQRAQNAKYGEFKKYEKVKKVKKHKKYKKFKILGVNELTNLGWLERVVRLEQERMKKLSEIGELTSFFFQDKLAYDTELLRWKNMTNQELKSALDKLYNILSGVRAADFTADKLSAILMSEATKMEDRGRLLWPLRASITGLKASPGPFEVLSILGKERALKRIKQGLMRL